MWCFEAEALFGAMIEAAHGEGDVLLGNGIETHLFWEDLTDETVHVRVGATLPGSVGMGKEEIGIELPCDAFVLGELLAIVGRQRMNAAGERCQQGDRHIGDGLSGLERHVGDQGIAGFALIERHERLLLVGADDQISFQIAEAFAAIDDSRALLDRHLVGDAAASYTPAITLFAGLLATQGAMQGARAAGRIVGVDALVDGFATDAGLSVGLEVAGDLFRTPQLSKLDLGEGTGSGGNAGAVFTLAQYGPVRTRALVWADSRDHRDRASPLG